MADYTYPKIFPDLRQENPRDLETWLSANVVNESEGDAMWAASDHYHADALQISATLGGGSISSGGVLAEIGHYDLTPVNGVPADTDVMVDVTVQVHGVTSAETYYWGMQIALQDDLVGTPVYHQPASHIHGLSGGTDSYGSDHYHTLPETNTGNANTTHEHQLSGGTSNVVITVDSGGSSNTGYASAYNHTHGTGGLSGLASGHQHAVGTYYATSNGVDHRHVGPSHTHPASASGNTDDAGSGHHHTLPATNTGYASAYNHTHGLTLASVNTSGHGFASDSITLRYVGTINTGAGANIDIAAYACSQSGASFDGIVMNGTVWVVPTVLAAQIGTINDLPDVQASEAQPGDLFVYSGVSSKWTPQTLAEAGVSAVGHEHLITENTYTATNVTEDRTFDADTVTVAELADIVGTLLADLKAAGMLP